MVKVRHLLLSDTRFHVNRVWEGSLESSNIAVIIS